MRRPIRAAMRLRCIVCGEEFSVHPYRRDTAKFCSPQCKAQHQRHIKVERVPRVCEHCGGGFLAPRFRVERGIARFCSNACKFQAARTRVIRACAACGEDFETSPGRLSESRGRFCSRSCYYHYSGLGPSGPELTLESALQAARIPFEREVSVGNWRVDFLIAGTLAVEVDGSFWHSLPGAREKDERKAAAIARRGWVLLRLDADLVAGDVADAVDQIAEALP